LIVSTTTFPFRRDQVPIVPGVFRPNAARVVPEKVALEEMAPEVYVGRIPKDLKPGIPPKRAVVRPLEELPVMLAVPGKDVVPLTA